MYTLKRQRALLITVLLMISTISFVHIPSTSADTITVGLWHFDEGSGTTAIDSSTFGNDGTIMNGATYVDGKFGKALSFDGTDDYVLVPDSPSLDITEITIEAWVKVAVLKNYDAIVIKGYDGQENCEALSYSSGMVHSPIKFTDGTRTWLNSPLGAIDVDVWHHVAMTYKPGEWRIYVDGYLVADRTDVAKTPQTNDRPLIIGAEENPSGGFMSERFFNGIIDEVRISNVALTALEIAQDAGLTVMPPATGVFGTVIQAYQDPSHPVGRSFVYTGYNPSVLSYSYSWTTPNPDPNAGNFLDLRWVNPVGTNSYVIWDMGCQVLGVRMYPTQDHLGWDMTTGQPNTDPDNPNDFEYHEHVVYASNDLMTWAGPISYSAFWLEGWILGPKAIADDAVKDYSFGGVPYRYIKIVPLDDPKTADDDYEIDAVEALELAPQRSIDKTLSPSSGGLGQVVHVILTVAIPDGETATVVDTLPPEFTYIQGTFKVNGVSATPTVTASEIISYTITTSGYYTIEFDVKVTDAYWEDRTVTNRAVATWYDELGNMIEQKEATADFVIHAFEQLHKSVGTHTKVKVIPAPVQFWRQFIGGVTDVIVSDPPGWPEPVALVRDYAILHEYDADPIIPLDRLTWSGTEKLLWERIDMERPYILSPGEVAEYSIYTDPATTAVLVRYTVAWESTPDIIEAHFVNEAILEDHSPQIIVGQLSNFDVHNDYHEPVDDFELELYGIQPSDIVAWFPGWGAPPQITSIPGGTEVMWMGNPVPPCQWVHFGLHLKPGVIATGVKAYWTQLWGGALTIKEKTNVQWALEFEVTNPFPYTMTNVIITDRFGAELEIDPPFPYSITHGTVSYTTKGTSRKIFLTWTIGNLLPGATARLIVLVSTDYNPGRGDCDEDGLVGMADGGFISDHWTGPPAGPLGYDRKADFDGDGIVGIGDAGIVSDLWGQSVTGHQEYTTPGIYELNSGATLKFIDPEQDMQLSAVTDSIYVTVLPLEDP